MNKIAVLFKLLGIIGVVKRLVPKGAEGTDIVIDVIDEVSDVLQVVKDQYPGPTVGDEVRDVFDKLHAAGYFLADVADSEWGRVTEENN
jgi:hypothetical protein